MSALSRFSHPYEDQQVSKALYHIRPQCITKRRTWKEGHRSDISFDRLAMLSAPSFDPAQGHHMVQHHQRRPFPPDWESQGPDMALQTTHPPHRIRSRISSLSLTFSSGGSPPLAVIQRIARLRPLRECDGAAKTFRRPRWNNCRSVVRDSAAFFLQQRKVRQEFPLSFS